MVENDGELVVDSATGPLELVVWPNGYRLHRDSGALVVVDVFGSVKARAGDEVRLGGGEIRSGTFEVCGLLEVVPPS